MTYELYRSNKEWRWRLSAANGRIIADSAEGYKRRVDALKGIRRVKESADAPVITL